MTTRLFVILARKADVAVVFRRGPTKRVLLLRWDLARDVVEAGQWLKGRVYERRCDLSPSGERLVYFAANYRGPFQTWTAISRPPYFTALALWPRGDAWGGGGLFATEHELLLNHKADRMALAEGFRLPPRFRITPPPYAGRGEDSPIYDERLIRDGWVLLHPGGTPDRQSARQQAISHLTWTCEPPVIWSKAHPRRAMRCELRMHVHGFGERQGPHYATSYDIADAESGRRFALGRADWVDWARSGDLLMARQGRLFRMAMDPSGGVPSQQGNALREVIDLSALSFEPRAAVPEALQWDGAQPRGIVLPNTDS